MQLFLFLKWYNICVRGVVIIGKTLNNIENIFIALGVSVGLNQIESILGIIILIFQFLLLTMKFFTKIKMRSEKLEDAIKNSNYEEVEDIIKDMQQDLKDYENEVKVLDNAD